MSYDYWQKQTSGAPLYPDILWEKPERRDLAGKLLVIGGSLQGIQSVSLAYETAVEAGIGETHILLPESLRKITKHIPGVDYLPATGDGAFSLKGSDQLLYAAQWADGVMCAGGIGRNSESTLLLSGFARSYNGLLCLTKDAIDVLRPETKYLLGRENTLLVASFGQLQKLATEADSSTAFLSRDELIKTVEKLHDFTEDKKAMLIALHHGRLLAAHKGNVVSCEKPNEPDLWCVETAAKAATFLLHHPGKPLEAAASALL